jgi:hypothetical protein
MGRGTTGTIASDSGKRAYSTRRSTTAPTVTGRATLRGTWVTSQVTPNPASIAVAKAASKPNRLVVRITCSGKR